MTRDSSIKHFLASRQSGFSLVELMIALVISLILIAGVIEIFISNRSSYALQQGMGRLQENGRYVETLFSTELSLAGLNVTAAGTAGTLSSRAQQPINQLGKTTNGAGGTSDTIDITYTFPGATDCVGGAAASGLVQNYYYVNNGQLMCQGNTNANPQALIDGVDSMQILYGIDTDVTADFIPNEYVTADKVPDWNRVMSVRVALLLNSVDSVRSGTDTNAYNLLDVAGIGPFNDMLRRRVYSKTILLRNVNRI